MIINKRMTARADKPFIVFLIGMRINNFWKINKWLPIAMTMPKMVKELQLNKDYGFIHAEQWFGRTTIMLQYWESFEKLESYARNPNAEHFPAWQDFNNRIKNTQDVGIYHETYSINENNYETIYHNMPPFGLGKATNLVEAKGNYKDAGGRMGKK